MRAIQVSIDVFQAIWASRKNGEENEDEILRRLLNVPRSASKPTPERDIQLQIGFHDPRYGVALRPGFEIFRTYKGKEYRAQAIQGFWLLNGIGHPTLNDLNKSIGIAGAENAWRAWHYLDDNNRRRPLSDLRQPNTIIRRGV